MLSTLFDLLPIGGSGNHVVIGINGFLSKNNDLRQDWNVLPSLFPNATCLALRWNAGTIMSLGLSTFTGGMDLNGREITTFAKGFGSKDPFDWLTSAAIGAVSLIKGFNSADNEWAKARFKAEDTGVKLARHLRSLINRTVILVGFSLGVRLIYYALSRLTSRTIAQTLHTVIMLGGAVGGSEMEWRRIARAMNGNLINGYSRKDLVLNQLYQKREGEQAIGKKIILPYDIYNVDLTSLVSGHLDYSTKMWSVLNHVIQSLPPKQRNSLLFSSQNFRY